MGIIFGGRSTEHEVSTVSATTVLSAIDPARYTPVLIGVANDGGWYVAETESSLLPEAVFGHPDAERVEPVLGDRLRFLDASDQRLDRRLDVIFPIVHGRGGEDGSLQGLLDLANVPYVGTGVLASATCMDKLVSKRILRDAGLPVLPAVELNSSAVRHDPRRLVQRAETAFPYPVFVKPTCTGSSVGVFKASDAAALERAIVSASAYDTHVLVEPAVEAREIECAVLGGHQPEASVLGEIVSRNEFYDYEAKYASDTTELKIPSELPESLSEALRNAAKLAFEVMKCWGMARVDFFVNQTSSEFWLNELNTHPGFTDGSMYPKLWQSSGIELPDLVSRLIELALERHQERSTIQTRFES